MGILNRRLARENVFQTIFFESWMIRASWAIIEDEQKSLLPKIAPVGKDQINNMHIIFSNNEIPHNADRVL